MSLYEFTQRVMVPDGKRTKELPELQSFDLPWLSQGDLTILPAICNNSLVADIKVKMQAQFDASSDTSHFDRIDKRILVGAPLKLLPTMIPYAFGLWIQPLEYPIYVNLTTDKKNVSRWCTDRDHSVALGTKIVVVKKGETFLIAPGALVALFGGKGKTIVAMTGYFLPYTHIGTWAYWLSVQLKYPKTTYTDVRKNARLYLDTVTDTVSDAAKEGKLDKFGGPEEINKFLGFKKICETLLETAPQRTEQ